MTNDLESIYLTVSKIVEIKGFCNASHAKYHLNKATAPKPIARLDRGNGTPVYDRIEIEKWDITLNKKPIKRSKK